MSKWELLDDDCMQYGKANGCMCKFAEFHTEEEARAFILAGKAFNLTRSLA